MAPTIIEQSTLNSLLGTFLIAGMVLGGLIGVMAPRMYRLGKARLLMYDPDAKEMEVKYVKLNGNEATIGEKKYILEGAAKLAGYPATWMVHPRHGWNLFPSSGDIPERGPTVVYTGDSLTDAQVTRSPLLVKLMVSNPKSYHLATATNRARDALNANAKDDKWGWVPMVALLGFFLIIVIFGMAAFIVYKVSKAAPVGA